ncbi:Glucosyltransferase-like protein [Microbotryomycetes sp. JL201]|nr:Glucosyltransferase-like protein [Microbotryomycetes sp. JL201]
MTPLLRDLIGFLNPPMRGDFEAQRHWIALTSSGFNSRFLHAGATNISVPVRHWYFHDLQYWGLDYPPLTAYHSMLLGLFARVSRGTAAFTTLRPTLSVSSSDEDAQWHQQMSWLESQGGLRHFMKSSVIVSDLIVYVTAVLWYCWLVAILTILLQPALILIDNGHFQFNSVMLGLTLWSVNLLQSGHDLLGSIAFVCAICYKQMALYYSPAVCASFFVRDVFRKLIAFFPDLHIYLENACTEAAETGGSPAAAAPLRNALTYHIHRLTLFVKLGAVTLSTFAVILSPFLDSTASWLQVARRVFPFSRGLFEDKVANVWCALNVIVKLKQIGTISSLARLALCATAIAVLPSVLGVLWISNTAGQQQKHSAQMRDAPVAGEEPNIPPTSVLLPHALFLSSMAFFLFSFQVHEKSILLPLMPLTLLMGGREAGIGRLDWEWGALINNIGVFRSASSMWPLLKRDGLAVQYVALLILWNFAIGYNPLRLRSSFVKVLSLVAYASMAIIHAIEYISDPPAHLPDLFVVANVGLSVSVFGLSFLWASKRLVQEGWVVAF